MGAGWCCGGVARGVGAGRGMGSRGRLGDGGGLAGGARSAWRECTVSVSMVTCAARLVTNASRRVTCALRARASWGGGRVSAVVSEASPVVGVS